MTNDTCVFPSIPLDCPDLDLPGLRGLPAGGPAAALLRDAHPRLRGVQVPQLHTHHQGFLRGPEHRPQERGGLVKRIPGARTKSLSVRKIIINHSLSV